MIKNITLAHERSFWCIRHVWDNFVSDLNRPLRGCDMDVEGATGTCVIPPLSYTPLIYFCTSDLPKMLQGSENAMVRWCTFWIWWHCNTFVNGFVISGISRFGGSTSSHFILWEDFSHPCPTPIQPYPCLYPPLAHPLPFTTFVRHIYCTLSFRITVITVQKRPAVALAYPILCQWDSFPAFSGNRTPMFILILSFVLRSRQETF